MAVLKLRVWLIPFVVACLPVAAAIADEQDKQQVRELANLSLEELANTQVTVVSRTAKPRSKIAAAVDVVTPEDIRRSGMTTLAEAVRAVPGVHVANANTNQVAVGVRGFTSLIARSQLVLMDGRSLYTPLFAGTYWDVQDTLLEDVERIEIVRGPGGTLWGANAVNGVINVVTKSAKDTLGGFITAGGGNQERGFVRARQGGSIGTTGAYRVYGKFFDRRGGFVPSGHAFDHADMTQGGFRTDWDLSASDRLTVQGDLYSRHQGERVRFASYTPPFSRIAEGDAKMSGANLLARWNRSFSDQSSVKVQAYYDRTVRDEASFGETRRTVDIDLQYLWAASSHQEVTAGAAYRVSSGRTRGVETIEFNPKARTDQVFSAYVQDEIAILPKRVELTLGTKMEHNRYTGAEFQPSVRLAWFANDHNTLWTSITRAVRTPSRLDRDISLTVPFDPNRPIFLRVIGNAGFETERLYAYEAGYRVQPADRLLLDLAAFYNRYPNLFSIERGAPFAEGNRTIAPFYVGNLLIGRTTGAELAAEARITDRWALKGSYSYLDMNLRVDPRSTDVSSVAAAGASPRHMVHLQSTVDATASVAVETRFRWIDKLPTQGIRSFSALDMRVAWRATPRLEFAVTGQNLLNPHHGEFGAISLSFTELRRSIFGEATWRW